MVGPPLSTTLRATHRTDHERRDRAEIVARSVHLVPSDLGRTDLGPSATRVTKVDCWTGCRYGELVKRETNVRDGAVLLVDAAETTDVSLGGASSAGISSAPPLSEPERAAASRPPAAEQREHHDHTVLPGREHPVVAVRPGARGERPEIADGQPTGAD